MKEMLFAISYQQIQRKINRNRIQQKNKISFNNLFKMVFIWSLFASLIAIILNSTTKKKDAYKKSLPVENVHIQNMLIYLIIGLYLLQ